MITEGKALLVIERVESYRGPEYFQFDVAAYIQSCSGDECARDAASEDFGLLGYDILPAPSAAYKLKIGDKVRVHVVYEFNYTRDYWGECDVGLVYRKERVLRRQPLKRAHYTAKEKT